MSDRTPIALLPLTLATIAVYRHFEFLEDVRKQLEAALAIPPALLRSEPPAKPRLRVVQGGRKD